METSPRAAVDRMIEAVGVPKAAVACKVAAVLFTYGCTIACRHCCFGCGPSRPTAVMTPEACVEALALLHETGRVIHIAGGEAMRHWDALATALEQAHRRGLAPHFIETNASFAGRDDLVRDRFEFMARHGVRGLYASADPYHQEFVPAANFLRVRRWADAIFGERNFYGPRVGPEVVEGYEAIARDEARRRDYVRQHQPVLVGRAQSDLAGYLDRVPWQDSRLPMRGWNAVVTPHDCAAQFRRETLWEVHLDPYGNLQTNCGVILGTWWETSPAQLLQSGPEHANRFVRCLCASGPRGLARLAATEHGFTPPAGVAQGCELCYLTRRFLRGPHPEVFGPAEIYG